MVTATGKMTVDGATLTASASFTVTTPTAPSTKTIIGMSAPASTWSTRLAEVGPTGIKARRIFGDLTSTGTDQSNLISAAHAAGMMPVVSYKLPSVTTAIAGGYDAWATAAANYLASANKPVAVSIWHEPHGDMTPLQFRQLHARLAPRFKIGQLKVGPILNGWLLDNRRTDFESYMDAGLLDVWDYVAIDTYQSAAGSSTYPGDRIAPLLDVLTDAGHASMPIGVGEYNGFDAAAIADSGEVFLSTPTLWFACVWNSGPTGLGTPLEGARLTAFQATKADARTQK